jgi:valyl-tRNA synthetase
MDTYADALERMARIDASSVADAAPDNAIQTVVDEATLALPLEGLVDFAAERSRLEKQIEKLEDEIARVDKKLGNANFVDRAPPAVVEQEKTRRADFTTELEKVKEALGGLPG